MNKSILAFIVLTFLVSGCTTMHLNLENLSIGMTKQEVISVLGKPDNVRTSFQENKPPFKTIDVWEYLQSETNDGLYYHNAVFFLLFADDMLKKWGRPGDFQISPDEIKEIRMR